MYGVESVRHGQRQDQSAEAILRVEVGTTSGALLLLACPKLVTGVVDFCLAFLLLVFFVASFTHQP
jgi:hypothetical protein